MIYHDIKLEHSGYNKRRGLSIDISFNRPHRVSGLRKKQRKKAWTESNQLREGFILTLVNGSGQGIIGICLAADSNAGGTRASPPEAKRGSMVT